MKHYDPLGDCGCSGPDNMWAVPYNPPALPPGDHLVPMLPQHDAIVRMNPMGAFGTRGDVRGGQLTAWQWMTSKYQATSPWVRWAVLGGTLAGGFLGVRYIMKKRGEA